MTWMARVENLINLVRGSVLAILAAVLLVARECCRRRAPSAQQPDTCADPSPKSLEANSKSAHGVRRRPAACSSSSASSAASSSSPPEGPSHSRQGGTGRARRAVSLGTGPIPRNTN